MEEDNNLNKWMFESIFEKLNIKMEAERKNCFDGGANAVSESTLGLPIFCKEV